MIFFKKTLLFLIINFYIFFNFLISQESYMIKKKDIENKTPRSENKPSSDGKKKENIKIKKNEETEKSLVEKKVKRKMEENSNEVFILKDGKFKIFYKPNQINLNQEDIIKILQLSNKLDKESTIIIKSYASKLVSQGSSEARRTSLSRALEIRSLFIENEFPAINILVRALGTENNNEGFTDLVVVEVN